MSAKDGVPAASLSLWNSEKSNISLICLYKTFISCAAKYCVPKLGSAVPLKPLYSACFPDLVAYNISTTGKMQVAGQ